MEGFEPSNLAAHAPEACVFASFTTSAQSSTNLPRTELCSGAGFRHEGKKLKNPNIISKSSLFLYTKLQCH